MRIVNLAAKRFVTVCDCCGAEIPKAFPYSKTHTYKGYDVCCDKCMFILDHNDETLEEVKRYAEE